jgi:hypothetical protein
VPLADGAVLPGEDASEEVIRAAADAEVRGSADDNGAKAAGEGDGTVATWRSDWAAGARS